MPYVTMVLRYVWYVEYLSLGNLQKLKYLSLGICVCVFCAIRMMYDKWDLKRLESFYSILALKIKK